MELKNKRVLVTGADGFIGSHLVEELLAIGCRVRAFTYYNSLNSWGWIDTFPKQLKDCIEVVNGDIRDQYRLRHAMQDIDVVFHLAALIGIPYSYYSPESYVDTNIKGTLNLMLCAKDLGTKRLLVTSTSEVYGTAKYVPIDEIHPLQGQSPYSASKIGADKIAESFFRSFNLPVTIVRPFNTFGPRQSARAIIPTIITQLLSGKNEIKLGNIDTVRDFNYVKDTVNGFIEIAKSERTTGEEINIASQSEISMEKLANTLIEIINPNATIISDDLRMRPKDSEVFRLLGSNKKIHDLTQWRQAYSFEKALLETVGWFTIDTNRNFYKEEIFNL